MSDPTPLTRGQITQRRHRRRQIVTAGLLAVASILGLTWLAAADGGQPHATTASVQTTTTPDACTEALDLGQQLAKAAGLVSDAAGRHLELMERLDLFLEGKKGGLSGKQVYVLGEEQMRVFEQQGPTTKRLAHQYQEVAARCPLK